MPSLLSAPAATGAGAPIAAGAGIIARPRLEAALDAHAERLLTVITGPAGSGKTVLSATIAAARGAAWLSMTPRHSDPARLADALDAVVADSVAGAPPPTLVLDDVHHVRGPALEVVRNLLEERGRSLRLVVASRADPDLGLARLRLQEQLFEIRAADLAFTEDETAQVLAREGLHLDPEQLRRLLARTEGWAAGLRLAVLSAKQAADVAAFLDDFAGDDRAIADYLSEEVLERYAPEAREFLLRTSVLDQVCGELADALTGRRDGGEMLCRLERDGALLVPLDSRRGWFRYHGLFRELLRARLDRAQPGLGPELHRRAAAWLAEHGRHREALPHVLAAEPSDALVGLFDDHWLDVVLESPAPALAVRTAQQLGTDGRLAVAAASICVDAGDAGGAVALLDDLDAAPAEARALSAVVLARARGDVDAARRAAADLEGERAPQAPGAVATDAARRAVTLAHLGAVELAEGDASAAAQDLEAGLALAREVDSEPLLVACLGRDAALDVVTGELTRAERHAQNVLALSAGDRRRASAGDAWAQASLAAVAWLRGEPDQAQTRVDLALAAAHASNEVTAADAARAVRGHLAIARGDAARARALLADVERGRGDRGILPGWLDALGPEPAGGGSGARAAIGAAIARLADGDGLSALRRVEPWLEPGSAAHPTLALHAELLAAVASRAVGRPADATEHLDRALELSAAGGCRQPFTRREYAIRPLLERHLSLGTVWAPHASEVLDVVAGAGGCGALAEELSDRERDVMRLLPTLLSSAEIGDELFISSNTVKSHIKSIYRKLDVSCRRDAVVRGRELRLI